VQSEARIKELMALGVAVKVVTIGKKVGSYYKRRTAMYNLSKSFDMGNSPTTAEAQARARSPAAAALLGLAFCARACHPTPPHRLGP
jgi:F0F1-type ATP synthase gamma subunit